MNRAILGAACLVASAGLAMAAEIAPEAVSFEDHGAVATPLTTQAGNPDEGLKVFATKKIGNCVSCHSITALLDDVPFHGNVGPVLDGVADRWSEAEIRGIVTDAKRTYEGTVMPSFYKASGYIRPSDGFSGKGAPEPLPPLLSAQQIEDVVAYLMTLKE